MVEIETCSVCAEYRRGRVSPHRRPQRDYVCGDCKNKARGDAANTCSSCGHDHPDEVAPAWGLPGRGPLCADCWSVQTEIAEADQRGDWATVARLAGIEGMCV